MTAIVVAEDKPGAAWCLGAVAALRALNCPVMRWVGVGLGGLPLLSLCEENDAGESLAWLRGNQAAAVLRRRVFRPHAWLDWDTFGPEARAELEDAYPHWALGPRATGRHEVEFAWVAQDDGQCVVFSTNTTDVVTIPEGVSRLDLAAACCAERRLAHAGPLACAPALAGEWEATPLHDDECWLLYGAWRAPRYEAPHVLRLEQPPSFAHGVNFLLEQARTSAAPELQACDLPKELAESLANLGYLAAFATFGRRAPDRLLFPGDGFGLWNAIAAFAHVPFVPRRPGSTERGPRRTGGRTDSDARPLLADLDGPDSAATDLPRRRQRPRHRVHDAVEDTYDLEGLVGPEQPDAQECEWRTRQQEPALEDDGPLERDEREESQSGPE